MNGPASDANLELMVENRDQVPLFIHIPEAVARALQEQDVDLVAALRESGLEVERSAIADPSKPEGGKDAGLVILASGASLYMVGLAVVKIVKAVTGRPVVGSLGELKPVLDAKGEVLKDASGQPMTYRVGEKQILSPEAQPREGATRITIPSVLEISDN